MSKVWVIIIWIIGEENIFFKESRQESKGSNNSEYLKGLSLKGLVAHALKPEIQDKGSQEKE